MGVQKVQILVLLGLNDRLRSNREPVWRSRRGWLDVWIWNAVPVWFISRRSRQIVPSRPTVNTVWELLTLMSVWSVVQSCLTLKFDLLRAPLCLLFLSLIIKSLLSGFIFLYQTFPIEIRMKPSSLSFKLLPKNVFFKDLDDNFGFLKQDWRDGVYRWTCLVLFPLKVNKKVMHEEAWACVQKGGNGRWRGNSFTPDP